MVVTKEIIEKFSMFEQECKSSGISFGNIVELMQRDTALPPADGCITEDAWGNYWHCSVCGTNVGVGEVHNNFCAKCGQRIKWK